MKKIIAILVSIFLSLGIQAQKTYYWYSGNQKEINTISNRIFVLVNNASDTITAKSKMASNGYYINPFKEVKVSAIPSKSDVIAAKYWTIIETNNNQSIISDASIDYYSPSFLTQDSIVIGLSHLFYVKLNSLDDVGILEKMALANNVSLLGKNQYMPLWFTLSCTKESTGNALQMANLFYESKLFAAAEPDFLVDDSPMCTNDTYFTSQWALNNTGQNNGTAGIDINYCDAHQITTGAPNIIVAVLDQGVELNHPDLTNMHPVSFDTESLTSPSRVLGNHGTACAGIIGATTNNNEGVTGIAPASPIMSISNSLDGSPDSRIKRANGINFACYNGVSIISNSWSSNVSYQVIDDAINNALDNGRNGKGMVVVFSSGNNNASSVNYPSSLNGVMSVGAMDRCGVRAGRIDIVPQSCDPWCTTCEPGSAYGSALSVVAPGTSIYTTDIQGAAGYSNIDYTSSFGGTSAACPYVAGVAALTLSVNPNLTQQEVRNIIESTAQKVRPDLYTYSANPNHPNGTWNDQMGYGLVDAYAAVMKAKDMDLYVRDNDVDNGDEPSNAVDCMWNSPDIWIEDGDGNIVDNPHGNVEYKLCVRIYNKKNISSSGKEKLFLNWTKAGVDLRWNNSWMGNTYFNCAGENIPKGGYIGNQNGIIIPSIAANSSAVVKATWLVPCAEDYVNCTELANDLWHFCLSARIYDGNTIPNENSTNIDMGYFVLNSNNVAWKNVSILHSIYNRAVVSVSNPYQTLKPFRLAYKTYPNKANELLYKYADVYLTLSSDLFRIWEQSNFAGTGFKRVGENMILLTGENAILDNLMFEPNKNYTIESQVNFFTQTIPQDDRFSFDITQYVNENDKMNLIGGEKYIAIRDKGRDFKAVALEDTTIFANESITFFANTINEDATYTWYNQFGDTIATGIELTTTPTSTHHYKLEVVSDSDGFKDYDTVSATVRKGAIISLSPNPATSQVTISYRLASNINSAIIQVTNTVGIVVHSTTISSSQTSAILNVQNLVNGQYSIQLLSTNGEVLDNKNLIVQ